MAILRLFASAREAAGTGRDEFTAATVAEVLDQARRRYGERFAQVLPTARVWVNGEPADEVQAVGDGDVVAVLPPVSGGAVAAPVPEPVFVAPAARARRLRTRDVGRTVRAGVAWIVVTFVFAVAGVGPLGVWFAAAAALAAVQVCRALRAVGEHPAPVFAAIAAAGLPLASIFGVATLTGALAALVFVALVSHLAIADQPVRRAAVTLAAGVPLGLAAASPVLLRHLGLAAPLVLLAFAAVHDAGTFVVGTGAPAAWEGTAAGVAALVPVTLIVAALLAPPFKGASPFVLGLAAAVLAPLGPPAATTLLGSRDANAPAVRRLDSLLVLGPVWAWCAAALVSR